MCRPHPFFAALVIALGVVGVRAQTPLPKPVSVAKLSPLAETPDWSRLEALSKTMNAADFEAAFKDIYSDGGDVPPPWQQDALGITVPTGAEDGRTVRIDFAASGDKPVVPKRYWRAVSELPPLNGKPVLTGLHIALDPGHIGGQWARMEERLVSFHPDKPNEVVMEGEHVLTIAQMIKPKLEALGARVSLVREKNEPVSKMEPKDFRNLALSTLREAGIKEPRDGYGGLSDQEKPTTVQWQSEKFFYRASEINARGHVVNDWLKPDVVVCLHLNAEPWGDPAHATYSTENHLHLLVNGCYSPDELLLQDVRFGMLHRLFSRTHQEEQPLAEAVSDAMALTTGLKPYVYVTRNARLVNPNGYVYARNLLANRIYDCPVIYAEPYVMNNQETYERLILGPYEGRTLINGKLRSSIYHDYAQGVIDGLVNYYRSKRK